MDPGHAREFDSIIRKAETSTLTSIAIGYRLLEVKELEDHGWLPWLAGRGINEPTARRAMELAQHHEYLTEQRPDQLQDFVSQSPLQALAVVHEERVTNGRAQRPRQQTPPVPAPVSNEELEAIGRGALLDDEPPLTLGDEPISMADLGLAAQAQIQAAITQPVERSVPIPTGSGRLARGDNHRAGRAAPLDRAGDQPVQPDHQARNRWAVEEALESAPASEVARACRRSWGLPGRPGRPPAAAGRPAVRPPGTHRHGRHGPRGPTRAQSRQRHLKASRVYGMAAEKLEAYLGARV